MEQAVFHIHAHLDIIINGVYFLVPSQIMIPSNCFYWLHTHDESGIIHIEAPMHRDFTLGQFFDIWNKKLSNDQIFNYVANATEILSYTHMMKLEWFMVLHHPSTIPSSYKFPEGL
jgi:hypothetical protein